MRSFHGHIHAGLHVFLSLVVAHLKQVKQTHRLVEVNVGRLPRLVSERNAVAFILEHLRVLLYAPRQRVARIFKLSGIEAIR